jgi:hypothetical protein
MADNFDLRQFLTENKLTKNTQLLNEGSDISGYWVMYGEPNKGIQQFIKMFPSEEEAQQALQNAPKTYGAHVLRSNWGIQSAQDWLASGKELGPDNLGHPDRVPPKRLSPEELKAIRQLDFDAEMEREGVEEGVDEAKGYSFTLTYNDAEYVQQVLDNAGVDAVAKAGTFDDEIIVRAFDGMGLRRAKQALEADHFDIDESVIGVKEKETVKENKMTQRDKYLTRLVENALGLDPDYMEDYPEEKELQKRIDRNIDQAMYRGEAERERDLEEGDEMTKETVIPEYNTVDELMKGIEEGTNKVAETYKISEMKKIAEALRERKNSLEESEHAQYMSKADLIKLGKDITAIDKAVTKLEAAFDKKFNKKEKSASAPKAEKVEALQEGFDLRNFLVENKLTTNSRNIEESAE